MSGSVEYWSVVSIMTYIGKTAKIGVGALYTEITNVDSIGDIGISADEIEDTVYSTAKWKTFIQGLIDGGAFDLVLNYDPTNNQHKGLITSFQNGTSDPYKITFPDTSTLSFSAFVSSVGLATPKDEKVQRTFTLRIDGKTVPVFSEA
jgi:predicted secreted protein